MSRGDNHRHYTPHPSQIIKHVAIASRVCSFLDAQEGLAYDEGAGTVTRGWMKRLITQLRFSIPREPQQELPPARLVFGHARTLFEKAERMLARDAHYFGNDDQIKPDTAQAVQRSIICSMVSLVQCTSLSCPNLHVLDTGTATLMKL